MKLSDKYIRLVRDTGIFAIGALGSKLVLFFLVPLYTNYMTEAEYGISDLVFSVAQLVMPFFSVCIFDSIVRFGLAKNTKPQNVLLNGLLVCLGGGVLLFVVTPCFGLYPAIAEWKWLLSTYVFFSMINSVTMNYLKVKDLNRLYAILSMLQALSLAGLNIIFLCYASLGVFGYLLSVLISCGLNAGVSFIAGGLLRDLRGATLDCNLLKEMVLFAAPLILNSVSWWVIQSSNKIMVDIMLGASALGVFTVATKIPSIINVMISIFSQAWGLSSFREIETTNDTGFYSNVLNVYQSIAFGASLLLLIVAKPFMLIYVGEDFFEAWRYLPLLLVSASFSAVASYYATMYSALKKNVNNMVTTSISAVVNVVASLLGIYFFGLWGAVIGTTLSYVVLVFVRIFDVKRYVSLSLNVNSFALNAVLALCSAVFVSLDLYGAVVSVGCAILFAVFNGRLLLKLVKKTK